MRSSVRAISGEILYSCNDFKAGLLIATRPAARSIRLDLPRFTVIGVTTRTGSLAAPLRDRIWSYLYFQILHEGILRGCWRVAEDLGRQFEKLKRRICVSMSAWRHVSPIGFLSESVTTPTLMSDGIIDVKLQPTLEMLEMDEVWRIRLIVFYYSRFWKIMAITCWLATFTRDWWRSDDNLGFTYEPYCYKLVYWACTPAWSRQWRLKAKRHLEK